LKIEIEQLEALKKISVTKDDRIKYLKGRVEEVENTVVGEADDPGWRDFKQAYKAEKQRAKNDGQIFSWAAPNKQHIYEELINIP
jgi:hypothetical protein